MSPADQKANLERRLRRALVLPAAIVFVLALVLGVQVERRVDYQQWVEHSELVLRNLADLEKEILDQEAGLRAFLLTKDEKYLEAYRRARPTVQLDELEVLVHDNLSSQARVREIRQRYERWRNSRAAPIMADSEDSLPASVREGKQLMDSLRAAIFGLQASELDLRHDRVAAASSSITTTRVVFVVLFLLAAGVLALMSRSQLAAVAAFYDNLVDLERRAREETEQQRWVRTGEAQLVGKMLGEQTVEQLGEQTLRALAQYAGADVGALFVREVEGWACCATLGIDARAGQTKPLAFAEGPVGRAATEKRVIHMKEVPRGYLHVRSGVGEHSVVELVVVPAISDDEVLGVLELGFLRPPDERVLDLLSRASSVAGSAIRSATYRRRLRELLAESQQQAEELQTQQEELRVTNEELEQQSEALREARQVLEERQEHLERTNATLEE
jgi:CHASE3 domain sensor protein